MENKIFQNDKGIIELEMDATQNIDAVTETTKQFTELSDKLRSENKPVLAIVDLSKIDNIFDSNLRKTGFDLLKSVKFDKLAMFSGSAMVRYLLEIFNTTIMKNDNMKVFETRDAAENWLIS